MPWSRGSLFVALLALPAAFACADTVEVNTTVDESSPGGNCSLREAVVYLSSFQGVALEDRPATHANGCKRKETAASDAHEILLTAGATYTVASEIAIHTSLAVKGAEADETRPVIQMTGTGNVSAFRMEVPAPDGRDTTSTQLRLAAASDTGVAADDYHTPNRGPRFESVAGRPEGTAVYLCRFDAAAATPDWVLAGTGTVAVGGSWQITPGSALPVGVNVLGVDGAADCNTVAQAESIAVSVYDPLQVSFAGLNVERVDCGAACPADGGIFHVSEFLSLDNMKVSGGKATAHGGAIFVAAGSSVLLGTVELSGNSAPQGAAVYAINNTVVVQNSLLTANAGATIVAVENETVVSSALRTTMVNSTFSGNTGLALSMRAGAVLNTLTIVDNTLGGVDFNSENVEVYNSIVAGNGAGEPVVGQRDCRDLVYVPASSTPSVVAESPVFKFNVTGAGTGCTASVNAAGSNSKEFIGQLMAGDANGSCSGAVQDGALCPLADNGGILRSHLPRLRAVDTLARNSNPALNPIINQGYLAGLPGIATAIACPSTDQREKSRSGSCDIGAVEVQLLAGTTFSGGQFESSGPSQTFSLREDIGDEELLAPGRCAAEVTSSNGSPVVAVPGCPWLLTQPTKGSVTFNSDGSYTYTPFKRFHGFDEFTIQVTTTASILNEGTDPLVKSRSVKASVFMEPDSTVRSERLLDGGALDWWYLMLGMLMLGGRVRWSK